MTRNELLEKHMRNYYLSCLKLFLKDPVEIPAPDMRCFEFIPDLFEWALQELEPHEQTAALFHLEKLR